MSHAAALAPKSTLIIACGALGRELVTVLRASRFEHVKVACLPAILHNRPEKIAPAVREKIRANRERFDTIFCLYGDCGTGGDLDRVLEEEGVERIAGAHCYEFFMGAPDFAALADEDPATFFLTDYLVRHFDRLVIEGLGLDRFPELLPVYFGNYHRVVYLAQIDDADLTRKAEAAAARLGLAFERRFTGMNGLERFLSAGAGRAPASFSSGGQRHLLAGKAKDDRPPTAMPSVSREPESSAAGRRIRERRRSKVVDRDERVMAEPF